MKNLQKFLVSAGVVINPKYKTDSDEYFDM